MLPRSPVRALSPDVPGPGTARRGVHDRLSQAGDEVTSSKTRSDVPTLPAIADECGRACSALTYRSHPGGSRAGLSAAAAKGPLVSACP